jgi:hypothetical protein
MSKELDPELNREVLERFKDVVMEFFDKEAEEALARLEREVTAAAAKRDLENEPFPSRAFQCLRLDAGIDWSEKDGDAAENGMMMVVLLMKQIAAYAAALPPGSADGLPGGERRRAAVARGTILFQSDWNGMWWDGHYDNELSNGIKRPKMNLGRLLEALDGTWRLPKDISIKIENDNDPEGHLVLTLFHNRVVVGWKDDIGFTVTMMRRGLEPEECVLKNIRDVCDRIVQWWH